MREIKPFRLILCYNREKVMPGGKILLLEATEMEKLWIDAPEFDTYGGFVLETQFVREMGQAYLMANGVGVPVAPATAKFTVTEGGYYRVYIRTKNWCPEHTPDGLVVEVDGVRAGRASGEMHVRDWYFEVGGDFCLTPGAHVLKIHDTRGWFARFSCVVITNDYDFTPAKDGRAWKQQRAEIKGLAAGTRDMGLYDLIVVGGGVGGIVAAITAARYGLRTALINDRPCLGGNGSDEANVALEGAAHRGYHETGVVFELKAYKHSRGVSWSEAFAAMTDREPCLDVFPNMLLLDADTKNGRITEILTAGTLDLAAYKFSAPLFVDATGDGWLGYYAGAIYRIGREARFQHGESFAPVWADGNTMSGCATASTSWNNHTACGYLAEKTDRPVAFKAPAWAFKLPEGDALGRTPTVLECGAWWLEMPNDYDDLFEGEFVRDSMLRMTLGYFDWLKNSWRDREKAACYALKTMGTYLAKRETRRLIGDYILTENDYTEGRSFPDAVGYCGWAIDVHHVDGIFSGPQGEFTLNKKIPITPLPFGALYSKNIDNLMTVGRCISTTHLGMGPTRVQLTIGTMGQAVGTAAHLCKKWGTTPRGIRAEHIGELQQLLLRDGMTVPGVKHADPADLAPGASVTASSFAGPDGAPENAVNGKVWQHDGADYAWVSDGPLPQSITLAFDAPVAVRQVRLTLDIPLDEYKYGYMEQPVARRMATDLSLSLLTEDGWHEVRRVSDNCMRLVVLDLEPTVARAVRITVHKTPGGREVAIPEIRIY